MFKLSGVLLLNSPILGKRFGAPQEQQVPVAGSHGLAPNLASGTHSPVHIPTTSFDGNRRYMWDPRIGSPSTLSAFAV